jgi:hypothetical protein
VGEWGWGGLSLVLIKVIRGAGPTQQLYLLPASLLLAARAKGRLERSKMEAREEIKKVKKVILMYQKT